MIIEYILWLIVLPVLVLCGVRKRGEINKRLLNKTDTLILKGISALMVVAAHYMTWIDVEYEHTTNKVVQAVVGQFGGIGVLIFFFVSGYGIYETYGNKQVDKHYLMKRLKGVYIPYIEIKIILLIFGYIFKVIENINLSSIVSIILIEDWFIRVIIIQYILFYIANKINRNYLIAISILADCVLTFIFYYENKPSGWYNALWLFTFGLVVSKYEKIFLSQEKQKFLLELVYSMICFIVSGLIFAIYKGAIWANAMKIISGIFLCIFICLVFQKIQIKSSFFKEAGMRSMYLYIVHIAMWNYMVVINNPILRLLVALIMTACITEILYRIVEMVNSTVWKFKHSIKVID